MMNWYYIDGPRRVGPFDDAQWEDLVRDGTVGPETLVWNETLAGWAAFRTLPSASSPGEEEELEELASGTGSGRAFPPTAPGGLAPRSRSGETPEAFIARIQARDYAVPIRECLARSLQLCQRHFWMLLGSTLLTWILISVGNSLPSPLGLVMPLLLNAVLQAGLFSVYLRLMRGERATPLDLFSGFDADIFAPLALRTLIQTALQYLCLSAVSVALLLAGFNAMGEGGAAAEPAAISARLGTFFEGLDGPSLAAVLLAITVCALPALYLGFCWIFATPLIWDKRMPCLAALRLSFRKVLQHPWRVGALLALVSLAALLPGAAAAALFSAIGSSAAQAEGGVPLLAITVLAMSVALPFCIGAFLALYDTIFNDLPASALPSAPAAGAGKDVTSVPPREAERTGTE